MAAINYSLIFYCEALYLDKYSKTEKQLMWENNSNHEFLSSFLPSFLTSILSLVEIVALDTVKMHNQHRRLHYFLGTNRHLHHFLKTNSNENTSSTHGTRLWFTTWMNAKQQQKNNNNKKNLKKNMDEIRSTKASLGKAKQHVKCWTNDPKPTISSCLRAGWWQDPELFEDRRLAGLGPWCFIWRQNLE